MASKNKSKFKFFSVHRSTPRTRCGDVPEPTFPKSNGTPFSLGAITPVVGTQKSVLLSDWWLTKKKNGLGIEGFESRGGSVVRRLFSSGAISERLESTKLETFDGITLDISGVINKSITLHNGFSLEVCNAFLLGFPYNWKDYNEEEKKTLFVEVLDDVVGSLRDLLGCPTKSLVPRVVGVKTRGMLKRRQDAQASIGQRVHTASNKRIRKNHS